MSNPFLADYDTDGPTVTLYEIALATDRPNAEHLNVTVDTVNGIMAKRYNVPMMLLNTGNRRVVAITGNDFNAVVTEGHRQRLLLAENLLATV